MAFYREVDGDISRDYSLMDGVERVQTKKALLEIVPSKAFGEMIFLDNQLQFSKKDEYIYHEMLVHPPMSSQEKPQHICILGGGDGCAAREVLKWPSVESIDIFDYDSQLVDLFSHQYSYLNEQSLLNPKVKIYIEHVANISLEKKYDVILVDLTDPVYENEESRVAWERMLESMKNVLKPTTSIVLNVGALNPWATQNIEWLLFRLSEHFQSNTTHTLEAYKCFVPSFASEWCFLFIRPLTSHIKLSMFQENSRIRYFDEYSWRIATTWTKDMSYRIPTQRLQLKGYLPSL